MGGLICFKTPDLDILIYKHYSFKNNKIIRPHKTLKNLKKEVYPEDINLKFLEEILKLKIKKNFKIILINKNK